jgi:hypothetical protein
VKLYVAHDVMLGWNIAGYVNLFTYLIISNFICYIYMVSNTPTSQIPKETVASTKHQSAGIYIPINYWSVHLMMGLITCKGVSVCSFGDLDRDTYSARVQIMHGFLEFISGIDLGKLIDRELPLLVQINKLGNKLITNAG